MTVLAVGPFVAEEILVQQNGGSEVTKSFCPLAVAHAAGVVLTDPLAHRCRVKRLGILRRPLLDRQ
jgi:hypothetical protein